MSATDTVAVPMPVLERLTGVLERLAAVMDGSETKARALRDALLTVGEVAVRLQKSRRDVERMVKAGKLKKVQGMGRRTTRFRPADVDRLTADKENKPGACRL